MCTGGIITDRFSAVGLRRGVCHLDTIYVKFAGESQR